MSHTISTGNTQNELLMQNLMDFYGKGDNLKRMLQIINGESNISLRIVDWFVGNYAKKYYTVYDLTIPAGSEYDEPETVRFKVYNEYKLKQKAYSKKRFDPFCRWSRITIPFDKEKSLETTIGQLNFFKWAIEKNIIEYIVENYEDIERDMNERNGTKDKELVLVPSKDAKTTRKKREELSISACKCVKKEMVHIVVKFT